jgi:hypothetical protein
MKSLLEHHSDDFQITEEVVKAAAGNHSSGKEIIEVLLKHQPLHKFGVFLTLNGFQQLTPTLGRFRLATDWLYLSCRK